MGDLSRSHKIDLTDALALKMSHRKLRTCRAHRTATYLRRPVEPRLDVRVHGTVLEAGRPKVNDLDVPIVQASQQHILRLQVAVDDVGVSQNHQCIQNLRNRTMLACMHYVDRRCCSCLPPGAEIAFRMRCSRSEILKRPQMCYRRSSAHN